VQSFRYVGKNSFAYEVPSEILDNKELLQKYHNHMMKTLELYEEIQDYVFEKTGSKERANEQARYVIPMSTHSGFVIGFTLEALIHYCNIRLCVRTEDVHREMARLIRDAALEQLPEIKDKLVPQCKHLLWCPESNSCGAYPSKKELEEKLCTI
jgi:thymidylate synthase (FAD)